MSGVGAKAALGPGDRDACTRDRRTIGGRTCPARGAFRRLWPKGPRNRPVFLLIDLPAFLLLVALFVFDVLTAEGVTGNTICRGITAYLLMVQCVAGPL